MALPAGVQMIPETVALIINNANLARQKVLDSDPATIAGLPQAVGFEVDVPERAADPARQGRRTGDVRGVAETQRESQAAVTTVSGRQLPIPVGDEAQVVALVSGPDRGAANSVYVGSDAPNFVQVTGSEPDSTRRESLWWLSNSGVRFRVPPRR